MKAPPCHLTLRGDANVTMSYSRRVAVCGVTVALAGGVDGAEPMGCNLLSETTCQKCAELAAEEAGVSIVGASSEAWEVSHPYRVRVGKYSWSYSRALGQALDVAVRSGVLEVELSPRMALDPTEQHEADEPPTADELYERALGSFPSAGAVAMADLYGSSCGEE